MDRKWFVFPEPGWYGRGLSGIRVYWDGSNWTKKVQIVEEGDERPATKSEVNAYESLNKKQENNTVPIVVGASAFVAIGTALFVWLSKKK